MKPGTVVNIYQKPIEKEQWEGQAKLIDEIRPDEGDGLSLWAVEFLDGKPGVYCIRTVNSN